MIPRIISSVHSKPRCTSTVSRLPAAPQEGAFGALDQQECALVRPSAPSRVRMTSPLGTLGMLLVVRRFMNDGPPPRGPADDASSEADEAHGHDGGAVLPEGQPR
ncbi:hypothetical protein VTK56DRAFT_2848 [Thermocarpiscus australiensis]